MEQKPDENPKPAESVLSKLQAPLTITAPTWAYAAAALAALLLLAVALD